MADLKDLNIPAISDMSHDEAIEHLRQIRLSRRVPVKKVKRKTTTKTTKAKKKSTMSKQQAQELLKLLGG